MRVAGATRQDANNIDQMKESTQIGEKGECTLQKKKPPHHQRQYNISEGEDNNI